MSGDFEKLLGKKIAYYRRNAEMTQQALAERIRVAPETISRLETGRLAPSLKTLAEIGDVLGFELKELFDFQRQAPSKSHDLNRFFNDLKKRSPGEIRKIHRIVRDILDFHGTK